MAKQSHDSSAPVEGRLSERYQLSLRAEAMQAADTVTRFYLKRRLPVPEEDIRQEAFIVAVDSIPTYDPAKGDPVAYLFDAARTGVGNAIGRWLSPVSVSENALKRGVKPRAAGPARRRLSDGEEEVDLVDLIPDAGLSPEARAHARRVERWASGARAAYATALREVLFEMFPAEVAIACEEVLGIGRGRQLSIQGAAKRWDLDLKEFQRDLQRLKRRVFESARLGALRREIDAVESEA